MEHSLTGLVRGGLIAAALSLTVSACTKSVSMAGTWDATVEVGGVSVPFRFEIADHDGSLEGWFFDGDLKVRSTEGHASGRSLVLSFAQLATRLEASQQPDGSLAGKYDRGARPAPYPFHARRHETSPQPGDAAPTISGVWTIPTKSSKGEQAWRFIVRQSGDGQVSGAILRVDGDTGTLTGRYANGKFVLSHFSGARPLLLEVTPAQDGSLILVQNGKTTLTAVRVEDALAKGLPEPTDPSRHTTMKDGVPFAFNFPDLSGRVVSQADPRFEGKVIVVNVTGSWCPNCHDEAPFLVELYRRYRSLGLEVVALSFEEADQLKNPTRLKAFLTQYGIEYTVLLAGLPEEVSAKIPQAVNLNAFPTTFFLGRDGRVRRVQAGFASPASGDFYTKGKTDIVAFVEALLAEPQPHPAD